MSTVIERIQELRRRRQGRYFDLCRESGKGNGQFIDEDLRELDETALLLGKAERTLADDLNAVIRFHALTRQVTDAEDQKPAVEKAVAKIEAKIKDVLARKNKLGGVTHGGRHDAEHKALEAELKALQQQHREACKPIGRAEVAKRQLDELVTRHPWVRGANGR